MRGGSGLQIESPAVIRADHAAVFDHALAQGAIAMRTGIIEHDDLAFEAGDAEAASGSFSDLAFFRQIAFITDSNHLAHGDASLELLHPKRLREMQVREAIR